MTGLDGQNERKIRIIDISIEQFKLQKGINELERMKQDLIAKLNTELGLDENDVVTTTSTAPIVGEMKIA